MRFTWLSWLPFVACSTGDLERADLERTIQSTGSCGDAPAVEILYADPGRLTGGVPIEVDPSGGPLDERFPRMRPFVIHGAAALSWSGPFEGYRLDGTALIPGDLVADETLLFRASAVGPGELVLDPQDSCIADPVVRSLIGVDPAPLAVRKLDGFPWIERFEVFTSRDTVSGWIDPVRYPDRVGLEVDLYVIPHRDPAGWSADPELLDAVAGPVTATVGEGIAPIEVWTGLLSGAPLEGYDLVADFGRDGRLDPGDLLDGLDAPGLLVGGNLAAPGPYTPVQSALSESFWLTMRIYHPEELDRLEPMPLVVISHGNGHDYTWYDYLGNHLASHGYVVISHRNDTMPGPVTAAETTWTNTDAFLGALGTLDGGLLDGEVDPHAIAWIGHSRGGEGVVIAYDALVKGAIAPSHFTADDIRLVSSIAPTVFEDPEQRVNPHQVTYHLLAGSLDGDVTGGVNSDVTQYLRIFQNSTGLSAVSYVHGADHNDFNCCGPNDANWVIGAPGVEIRRPRAQQLAKSYYLALLEGSFRSREPYWEYLTRAPERLRPDGTEVVVSSQLKRADAKLVIDDFQTNPDPALSSSGGRVTATVRELFEGVMDDRNGLLTDDPRDPMNGMSQSEGDANPAQGVVFEWASGEDLSLEFEIPAGERDLTDDGFVSFRACQMTRHPNTRMAAGMVSFSVALVDGAGNVSEIDHRVYGGIPAPYRRNGLGGGIGWVNEFQSIRIPIEAFAYGGQAIDLADIAAIRFLFGEAHGAPIGRVGLDDVEILAPTAPGVP